MSKPLLPALGLIGEAAIREAFAGDFLQLGELLRGKLKILFKLEGDADPYAYVRALFNDAVVVERNGKLLRYPYTVDGTDVTFGEPSEVLTAFVPAKGVTVTEGALLEAQEADGGTKGFRIRVIRAGLSGNRNVYPDAVLREAVPLFEKVRVFVKSDAEHLAGAGKDVRNLIGQISNVAFVEGKSGNPGEMHADLTLIEPAGPLAVKLREAWDRGMSGLFGFSIDATAAAKTLKVGTSTVREATKFLRVKSVDLIVEPGAGGEVLNVIEAQSEITEESDAMWRDQIIAMIEGLRPELLKGKDKAALSDTELVALVREAQQAQPAEATPPGVDRQALDDAMGAAVHMVEARINARERIGASTLPQAAKDRLTGQFQAAESFTEAQVVQAIKDEQAYLATMTESGTVRGLGDDFRIEPGESRGQKTQRMLEAFFDPAHKDHRHARSLKDIYINITGDARITGQRRHCDQALMREALDSASFDDVLGDGITRRALADYRTASIYDVWRPLVRVVSLADFRNQERTAWGGYTDLPTVAQGADYQPLTSPTDRKATYQATKKGGTENVTREMILNDDADVVRQIPIKLSRSAKRTLGKFVLDFLRNNPVIYDGVTLFHASHGNLLTVSIGSPGWAAARLAMMKQAEPDSGEILGIGPKYLWVPGDLEEGASDTFRRNTNQDETFIQSLKPSIVPVWYWTDPNDWCASADPTDIPTIELGFVGGQEEPEVFVQDSPNSGSLFAADKITYKIRHEYGAGVMDYKGMVKSVVA